MVENFATIDFETRSLCDLKKSGSWRYSLDPSTEVLCLAYRVPFWDKGRVELWHPAFPHLGIEETASWTELAELFDWVSDGNPVEAHNAWFERGVWRNIMEPRYGWDPIPAGQWRCSAARGASHALPRALDDAGAALGLSVVKDKEGHDLMMKMTRPRKPTKADVQAWQNRHNAGECPECSGRGSWRKIPCGRCRGKGALPVPITEVPVMPVLWHESREMFERLWAYCKQDVRAEVELAVSIPELSDAETELYILDQTVNERGFQLDQDAVKQALRLIEAETADLNGQIAVLTNGAVTKATQRQRMMNWFEGHGLYLENTQAQTIDDTLKDADRFAPPVKTGLTLMRELGRSSTAKYQTMQHWMCPDGRVHGGLLYHGASTGRWSGAGVQPHNFVRGGKIKLSQDDIWTALKTGDRDALREKYKSVMLLLSEGLRGAICATPGHHLYVADYASIEARVLLWVAGDEAGLDLFRKGADIYCEMASSIYDRPITKADAMERQLGKAAVLGCGYQMGAAKFVATAATYGVIIKEEFSTEVVNAYRSKFWRVKQLWWDQEAAALQAMASRRPVRVGRITWELRGRFLYCTLPSGRRLAYPDPEVQLRQTPWGEPKDMLTYMGINTYTRQWGRQTTYGGKLVENIVQAISRDLMADAMLQMEKGGVYRPVLSVHDELIAEAPLGQGDVHEFEQLMATVPAWAKGCPVKAEGWRGERYHK